MAVWGLLLLVHWAISHDYLQASLALGFDSLAFHVNPSKMSWGPEETAAFLDLVYTAHFPLCSVEFQQLFVDAKKKCIQAVMSPQNRAFFQCSVVWRPKDHDDQIYFCPMCQEISPDSLLFWTGCQNTILQSGATLHPRPQSFWERAYWAGTCNFSRTLKFQE